MKRGSVILRAMLVAVAAVLAGCVQAPKQIYLWERFPKQQYETLLHEGVSPDAQIREMEAHAEKARATGAALPPGFRAHLGLLHLAGGDAKSARRLWIEEKTVFPEAAPYMDQLLRRLEGTPKAGAKENPA